MRVITQEISCVQGLPEYVAPAYFWAVRAKPCIHLRATVAAPDRCPLAADALQ